MRRSAWPPLYHTQQAKWGSTDFQENNGWVIQANMVESFKLTCSSICRKELGVVVDSCYERIWFPVFSMLYPVKFITGLFLSTMLSCDWLVWMRKLAFFLQCSAALHVWLLTPKHNGTIDELKHFWIRPELPTTEVNVFQKCLSYNSKWAVSLTLSLSWHIYMDTFSMFQESATLIKRKPVAC